MKSEWSGLADRFQRECSDERLARLAADLGVSAEALREIGIGWADKSALGDLRGGFEGPRPEGAYTVPERDGQGNIVGLSLRAPNGRKGGCAGMKRGLVVPASLAELPDPVFVVEGASDVAAALSLGIAAVGRPTCKGGAQDLAELLKGRDVLVVGENDEKPGRAWPGRDGALAVARGIASQWRQAVRWTLPPESVKDLRALLRRKTADGLDLADEKSAWRSGIDIVSDLEAASEEVAPDVKNAGGGKQAAALVSRAFSEIEPDIVRWLWEHRIPLGKISLLYGDPGLGKSLVTIYLAARVSRGGAFPDGTGAPQGSVLLLSAEDDAGDTIRPRLDAAGADVDRVHEVRSEGGWPNLAADLELLEAKIEEIGDVRLVVIDPVSAYLGGTDGHKNAEMRALLGPLSEMAGRTGAAVVLVTHEAKGKQGTKGIHRAIGSIATIAAARAAWAVVPDAKDEDRHLVLPAKANLGPRLGGLAYRVASVPTDSGEQPVLDWEPDPVSMSLDEALAAQAGSSREPSRLDEAKAFLRDELADGPVLKADIKEIARREGVSWRTLERASKALRVTKGPGDFGAPWQWELPDTQSPPQPPRPQNLAASAQSGRNGPSGTPRLADSGAPQSGGLHPPTSTPLADSGDLGGLWKDPPKNGGDNSLGGPPDSRGRQTGDVGDSGEDRSPAPLAVPPPDADPETPPPGQTYVDGVAYGWEVSPRPHGPQSPDQGHDGTSLKPPM